MLPGNPSGLYIFKQPAAECTENFLIDEDALAKDDISGLFII
jgi:hypothetical protein